MISEWVGSDRVGSVIEGQYPLQRWLGGAEESGVFLTQLAGRPPRDVAIKIIPAGIADADCLLDQWLRAKRRIHRNLIQLYAAGRCRMDDCDLLYAVTDCADEILADVLRARPLTPREVREMLESLLDTLSWLHGQGLVHGGLKPSNIMVVSEQIELSVDRIQPAGRRIFPVLSPGACDAPESAGKITPAADLWSLGVLLVESLTQNPPPWDGNRYRIPVSVPQPFAAIASECLRLDPVRRCTLRDIRSHLTPGARSVVLAAPISNESVPTEASHGVQAEPPAGGSPDTIANLSSDLLPNLPSIKPADLAERVAALLDPTPRVATPAVPQPPVVEERAAEAPARVEPMAATATPTAFSPISDLRAAVPATFETAKSESPAPTAEASAIDLSVEAPAVSVEAPAVSVEARTASAEAPANRAPGRAAQGTSGQSANAALPATAAQRRANIPEAPPVKPAQMPPRNRRATMVASAMVLIAAGLMVAIALHLSPASSSPTAKSSSSSKLPVSPKVNPPRQGAAVPASPTPGLHASASASSASAAAASIAASPISAPIISTGPITPGAVIQRVLPHVTPYAMNTIGGRLVVIVRVQVDANGNVSDASYDYEGNSHYLKTAALAAARNWKFRPAESGGRPVPSTWDLQFWFDQTGPSVIAKEKTS